MHEEPYSFSTPKAVQLAEFRYFTSQEFFENQTVYVYVRDVLAHQPAFHYPDLNIDTSLPNAGNRIGFLYRSSLIQY